MMRTQLSDLENFLLVIEHGSFSGAARSLNVPVVKLSRSIKRLEDCLNLSLFTRTTRRLRLTADGEIFAEKIKGGLATLQQAEEWAKSSKGEIEGPIRIDAATPFMMHQILPYIDGFLEQYPKVSLELITTENNVNLIEENIDLAFRIGPLVDSRLVQQKLGYSNLKVVATPEYLGRYGNVKAVEDLETHICLGFTHPSHLNIWPVFSTQAQKMVWQQVMPHLIANNGEILKQLCLQGRGLGCFSNFMIHKELECGSLIPVFEGQDIEHHAREEVHVVFYKGAVMPLRIRKFLEYFKTRILL